MREPIKSLNLNDKMIPEPDHLIKLELQKYSVFFVKQFFELFPSTKYQGSIWIKISDLISQSCPVYYDSVESFWLNWNKYNSLKLFI